MFSSIAGSQRTAAIPRALTRAPVHPALARAPVATLLAAIVLAGCSDGSYTVRPTADAIDSRLTPTTSDARPDPRLAGEGKRIFRFDTFGDEAFWTDQLRMHEVIAGGPDGIVGSGGVSPRTALAVGLKVDLDALPQSVRDAIAAGQVNLDDPATTLALLQLDAVVGAKGTVETVNGQPRLTRFGITCALCHSTVDNSFAPGIGHRLDGWPNRDLNVGLIVSLSPALQDPATQAVLTSWGPGKYDAYWNHDGINDPTVIPPAYGLRHVDLETFTGEGPISYWNAYVAVTQMHGQGNFSDPRLGITVTNEPDLVTPKLPALREYQRSLDAPAPPRGSFDVTAARRGRAVFAGAGRCVSCHTGPALTDAGRRLHDPAETGMNPLLADRATTGKYRTTPLRGAWQHPPYFHDGSAATLADVVSHYDRVLHLGLTMQQKHDLIEYLKSL
jgi:mono/diheme cytochrome c family protein/cytochrome c5